ncbi:hypothetical protein C8255_14770 [filamentous cyanobacterium CCP3]|nr:hypothetical protein C8255_14770 [filamentous cyanobacterium CCP3]
MASTQTSALGTRQIQQALRRSAKAVLVASGIQPSTRRGNKELTLAVQRLAQQPYNTLEDATQAGAALGQKIAEISQAKGLTNLDGGIVRQLMLTGDIPTVTEVTTKPAKTAPVVVAAPQAAAAAPAAAVAEEAEVAEVDVAEAEIDAIAGDEPDEPAEPEAVESIDDEADAIAADEPAGAEIDAIAADEPAGTEAVDPAEPIEPEPEAVGTAR